MLLLRERNNDIIKNSDYDDDDNDDGDDDYIDHDDDDDDDDDDTDDIEMKITIYSKDINQNVFSQDNLIRMKRQFPDLDYDTLCR
jgi:hypothetical protein